MGSLSSRPSVPTPSPQVVYVPQASATATNTAENTNTQNPAEETASEVRRQSLLGRERSRFGTIQTGFRGLLSSLENSAPRKTLLGE